MKYFVSRQLYWPDGIPVVEIACGGLNFSNPDMMGVKYKHLGEGQEYDDPREAVEAAWEIVKAWRTDGEKKAKIAYGSTGGWTLPFDPSTLKDARKWAEKHYQSLPKCDQCGGLLGNITYSHPESDDKFCSEYCVDNDYSVYCGPNDV